VALDHRALDITDPAAVAAAVEAAPPDVIVNCAAFNDVDGAEERPEQALAVNAFAVRSLALAAEQAGAVLVQFSTDFVFDGRRTSEPYTEDDAPSPRSTYASSKLMGEWFALDAPRAYVLRVESLFGSPANWTGRRGTLDAIVDGLAAGREVRVFTDRVVSPSYTPDIAAATKHLIESGAVPGLYHCVNDGHATWEQIAREAAGSSASSDIAVDDLGPGGDEGRQARLLCTVAAQARGDGFSHAGVAGRAGPLAAVAVVREHRTRMRFHG
jgi:dTDP-4-dehydrorhamnose reductase